MKNLQNLCRRSLSLLLALVMCISVMQIPAFATEGGEAASGSEPPSSSSSDNSTSSSGPSSDASGGGESGAPSGGSENTGSTTTTSPANSGSGDSTGDSHETSAGTGGDASDNGGSGDTSSGDSESKTETADSNESSSNNTETTEPAGSNDDQTTGAPANAPTNDGSGTPANEGDTQKNEPAQNTGAAEFIPVTPTDLVTGDQEKNDTENDAWDQVVDNLSTSKGPMMAAAPAQQGETQDTSENDTTEATEPQSSLKNGVTVTVTPNEDENSQTVAVKPDGVPDKATWDKDKNCWTWTEVTKEGGTTTPSAGDSEDLPDLKDYTEETSEPETKTDKDGKTYTETVVTYTSPDGKTIYKKTIKDYGKGEGTELEKSETTPITITTTTTDETTATTVTPGTVTVEMSQVDRVTEDGSKPITQDELNIKDATVTITKGDGENYTANVKLGLSGTMLSNGSVQVTIAAGDKTFTTTLDKLESDNSYTLTGINLGDLSAENGETISVTLTGEQIKTITKTTESSGSTLQGVTESPEEPNYVTIEFDENGEATKVEIKDEQKIQNVKDFLGALEVTNDFAIYADEYGQGGTNHIDGNICVNKFNNKHENGDMGTTIRLPDKDQCGPVGATNKEKEELIKDYVYNGFSYVGALGDGVKISVTCNTHEKDNNGNLINGATLVTGAGISVGNTATKDFDVIELNSQNFENGQLKSEVLTEHPELSKLPDAVKIDANLGKIATAGAILNQVEGSKDLAKDLAKIETVGTLLESNELGSNDVVSITISIDALTEVKTYNKWANQWDKDWTYTNSMDNALANLVKANKNGTKIIINVDMRGADPENPVVIDKKMNNGVQGYDGNAANLVWNFGNYGGTIRNENSMCGRVIGANATLDLFEIQAGNAVGKIVSHGNIPGGEIHMAVPGKPAQPSTSTNPGQTTTTEKHQVSMNVDLTVKVNAGELKTEPSGGDTKTEITSTTTNTYEPATPDTPDNPNTPDTPDNPDTPDKPTTPDKPDPKPTPTPEPPEVEIPDPDVPLTPAPEEPTPDPDFPDDPDANTPNVPDVPDVDIPDDDVPLAPKPNLPDYPTVSILDNDVPMASVPSTDDGLVEIEEEEIPLADVPQTGDTFGSWALLAALSLCGVTALALPGKRKER